MSSKTQSGFAPILIVIVLAIVIGSSILVIKNISINQPKSPPIVEQQSTDSAKTKVSPSPIITKTSTPTATPTVSNQVSPTLTVTPKPTVTAVDPYQLEAELICARADEGYAVEKHVDLKWQVTVNEPASIPFGTLTLTDNKTKTTFDFGNVTPSGNDPLTTWEGLVHWKIRDRDGNEMPFVGDGREYTLKLYKLTTRSQAITKDLQPVAQKNLSKICEY